MNTFTPYTLPPLPYAFDALEPYIDTKTMELHHDGHHAAYVENLNKALEKDPAAAAVPLEQLLAHLDKVSESVRIAVRNNGGGHYNHSLFWQYMKKNGGGDLKKGPLLEAIEGDFASFDAFKTQFNDAAKKVFGSGWAWLCLNSQGKLEIVPTPNQDNPLSQGKKPIMGIDVWEHAYYLKYTNKRVNYIEAWWHVLNWDFIEQQYRDLAGR